MADLEKSLLELVERAAWDLPGDVERALRSALRSSEEGTNGRAALDLALRSVDRCREERIPLGAAPVALIFTVEAPAGTDLTPFRAAAEVAAQGAAESGLLDTPATDLPSEKPRRGKSLGLLPDVRFLEGGPGVRVHVRLVSPGEAECVRIDTLPGPTMTDTPSLDTIRALVLTKVEELQGQTAGPGVLALGIGGEPGSCLAAAEAELLRTVGHRSPRRPFGQWEVSLLEDATQLNIGPLGLGGSPTLLAVHAAGFSAPRDQWTIGMIVTGWNFRRHTVQLDAAGRIKEWDTVTGSTESSAPSKSSAAKKAKSSEPAEEPSTEPASATEKKSTAKKSPGKKSTEKKSTEKKPTAAKKTSTKTSATKKAPAKNSATKKSASKKSASKKSASKKSATKKSATKKSTSKKSTSKKSTAK